MRARCAADDDGTLLTNFDPGYLEKGFLTVCRKRKDVVREDGVLAAQELQHIFAEDVQVRHAVRVVGSDPRLSVGKYVN